MDWMWESPFLGAAKPVLTVVNKRVKKKPKYKGTRVWRALNARLWDSDFICWVMGESLTVHRVGMSLAVMSLLKVSR